MVYKRLRKKAGFAVLMVLVSIGVIAILSASLYSSLVAFQRSGSVRGEWTRYKLLAMSLESHVNDPQICTKMFKNQRYYNTSNSSRVTIRKALFDIKKFSPKMKGSYVLVPETKTKYAIRAIQFNRPAEKLYSYKAYLQVQVKSGNIHFNFERLNIKIPLIVNVNRRWKIKSCYGLQSKAYICESKGGAWDPKEKDLKKQCNPDENCIIINDSHCPSYAKRIFIGQPLGGVKKYICVWCNTERY